MSNRELEDKYEEEANRELAKRLGINYDELMELDYEVHEDANDDGLVYGTYVEFNEEVAPEILKKIEGLDENYTIIL